MRAAVVRVLGVVLGLAIGLSAGAAPVQFSAAQQESVNKISSKGGLVMQLANDSDLLVVNLSLAGKQATDAELAEVAKLPKVAQLNLANTAVTDKGLANVAGLGELTTLHLEKTGVTDAGLAHVKGLVKLEYLNLYGTAVTDAGLANLSGLKNLKKLYLWQTKVTDGGVGTLKKAVAGVVVNRGEELAIVVKPVDPPAAPASGSASANASKAINKTCPVSGKPVEGNNVLTHEGKVIGFCCDKCPKAFAKEPAKYAANIKADAIPAAPAKTEEKKPEVKKAEEKKVEAKPAEAKPAEAKPAEKKVVEEQKPEAAKPQAAAAPAPVVVALVNTKCPVSGKDADSSFTANVDAKTVGFCCDKCLAKFNKDPKKFADKIVADVKK
jgi:YHS domain-containing protein